MINLRDSKAILTLPNDLVFVIDKKDNFYINAGLKHADGTGHEPYMIKKILSFTNKDNIYVEVGANYGDFVFQASLQVGSNGKVYAFEPGPKIFKFLQTSLFLNSLSNVAIENLAVLDKIEDGVDFIETDQTDIGGTLGSHVLPKNYDRNMSNFATVNVTTLDMYFQNKVIDVMRLDAEGSECKILKGARSVIEQSKDIRIFVEWQYHLISKYESEAEMNQCLSTLMEQNFILLDTISYDRGCDYKNHILSIDRILNSHGVEFLAIRESTLQNFITNYGDCLKIIYEETL